MRYQLNRCEAVFGISWSDCSGSKGDKSVKGGKRSFVVYLMDSWTAQKAVVSDIHIRHIESAISSVSAQTNSDSGRANMRVCKKFENPFFKIAPQFH